MCDVPRSKQFDDVYFSVQDGLAETGHVFLKGNNLPEVWGEKRFESFTVCETGFGTGLNFLALMKLWQELPEGKRPDKLHFVSFEKFPLSREEIRKYLSNWSELSDFLDILVEAYPADLEENKVYNMDIVNGVALTIIIGDINEQMPMFDMDGQVDCWFLDGFKPSSNPDMWSNIVFSNMARLSRKGASFATFTAAGFVRRGLAGQGFEVRKVPGFGRKREMCVGIYSR